MSRDEWDFQQRRVKDEIYIVMVMKYFWTEQMKNKRVYKQPIFSENKLTSKWLCFGEKNEVFDREIAE